MSAAGDDPSAAGSTSHPPEPVGSVELDVRIRPQLDARGRPRRPARLAGHVADDRPNGGHQPRRRADEAGDGGDGADGGWELRLPVGADYLYAPGHAVSGWADPGHYAAWPELWNRADCPPPDWPHGTHDLALALSDEAGGGRRLAHSRYGWWAPVRMFPERIVASGAGCRSASPPRRGG